MAEDNLFSAMWRSIVPTADGCGRAGDVEASPVIYWNPHEMAVEDMTAYYAEPVQDHRAHVYEDMEPPINHWNGGQMTVHDYAVPVAEEVEISAAQTQTPAPFNSELVYYAADPGVEAIDYDWNQYVMTNGYREAEVVKDIVTVDDVKKLTNHSQTTTGHAQRRQNEKVKIFRVPATMRTGNEHSYEPRVVSIGPYHCQRTKKKEDQKHHLDEGENEKWHSLNAIRFRTRFSANDCIEQFKEIKNEVKERYEGEVSKEWDRLEMILDACFILYGFGILPSKHMPRMKRNLIILERLDDKVDEREEAVKKLLSDSDQERQEPVIVPSDDLLPFKSVPFTIFTHDIGLLENQIPFCTLEKVYEIAIHNHQKKEQLPSLRRQVAEYLHKLLILYPSTINIDNEKNDDNIPKFEHILDYYHKYFKPSTINKCTCRKPQETQSLDKVLSKSYRAMELYEVGVKFKSMKSVKCGRCGKSSSLLDIKFMNGTLKIPSLVIDGKTLSLFKNILAYEQKLSRHDSSKNYFTAYVKFLANLMITEEDISLLTRKKIIVNHLGNYKKVMDLFSKLMEGVAIKFDDNNYLTSTYFELDEYYNFALNEWRADIQRMICRNPRLITAFLVAAAILIATVIPAIPVVVGWIKK